MPAMEGHRMQPLRLAMWSGPRTISTAMMRAWENRSDTIVCDEPFYAHYLLVTGIDHPGRDAIIAAHETNWRNVVSTLTGPLPRGKSIFYQKHMAHHLLPEIDRSWLYEVTNCFLLRDPREMLASLTKVTPNPTLADTGLPQQSEIFQRVREASGATPPVVDSRDVLLDPRAMLAALCQAVAAPFDDAMLHWRPGTRDTDGAWARFWYDSVIRSTGFEPYAPRSERLPQRYHKLLDQCQPYYDRLHACRLRPVASM